MRVLIPESNMSLLLQVTAPFAFPRIGLSNSSRQTNDKQWLSSP